LISSPNQTYESTDTKETNSSSSVDCPPPHIGDIPFSDNKEQSQMKDISGLTEVEISNLQRKQAYERIQRVRTETQSFREGSVAPATNNISNASEKVSNDDGDDNADGTQVKANLDAFAALERKLAKRRLKTIESKSLDKIARSETPNRPPISLVPPAEPEPWECCGKNCANCVWITYADKLIEYEEAIRNRSLPPNSVKDG
jgi:hypothetical protein